ncbi:phytanoyl-CoA dioxygenase family protein [Chamaesiphon polymorphus]|uniref:Phytanoyl-CoA dioxygenase n=1 Tax=Chamaesiphon polymorphus CCALA 037 TaxID=2107692 RepID=A0A2T1G2E4_9CYAN|nr:phytanoyl-CoA dioxygenase family protein [Chamaesiphon polymorphus]PSB51330.1 phytanoyl-CoA dioxygenase [Chamaesiphon polymorphus CCALA 037]
MDISVREVEERGFVTIDSYLDPDSIDLLIADINTLDLTSGRAGIRNILELVPSVSKLARSQEIRALVEPILGDTARVVRGIFFDKQPNANWKVPWHQDLSIAVKQHLDLPDYHPQSIKEGVPHVQPPIAILERMLTVRIHLDRTDESNGALKVIPGSHRQGKLTTPQIDEWKQLNRAISCNCQAGGVLLMRPLLLHSSSIATTPSHRRVIHLEYADRPLDKGLEWYY